MEPSTYDQVDYEIPNGQMEIKIEEHDLSAYQIQITHTSTQTSADLLANTPKMCKLRQKLKTLQNENGYMKRTLAKFEKNIPIANRRQDNILDKNPSGSKKPKRCRYDEFEYESVSPLREQNLKPLVKLRVKPGIDENVFQLLSQKIRHSNHPLDKLCVICVDDIRLRANVFYATDNDKIIGLQNYGDGKGIKVARNATVLMARGLCSNWEQPLAYIFGYSKCPAAVIQDILFKIIEKLPNIGLSVLAFVCNQTKSNMVQLAKNLNISPDSPSFTCGNQTISFIFDPPNLLKSLRDSLISYNFFLEGNIISWQFISQFYEHDTQYPNRGAPALSKSHISPEGLEKQELIFAAQIFSLTLALCMNLYIRFGKLPAKARATEDFIRNVNNLFDMLNSSRQCGKTKYQNAYAFSKEENGALMGFYRMFEKLQILDFSGENIASSVDCVKGWKVSIKGLIRLGELAGKENVKYLFTRRINLDCLDNFFESLRRKCNYANPSPVQFVRSFNKLFSVSISSSGDKVDVPIFTPEEIEIVENITIDTDYRKCLDLERNFTGSICKYLIKKSLDKHNCDVCQIYADTIENLQVTAFESLEEARQNPSMQFARLNLLHQDFVAFVTSMEILFQKHIESIICTRVEGVVKTLVDVFRTLRFRHPCSRFNCNYLYYLYARVRLFYALKCANRNFRTRNGNRTFMGWRGV